MDRLLVTLEPPTGPMCQEAAAAGFYVPEHFPDRQYPRVQIPTIEQLLSGNGPDVPRLGLELHADRFRLRGEPPDFRRASRSECCRGCEVPARAGTMGRNGNEGMGAPSRRRQLPTHHCDICPLRQPVSTAYPGIPSCLTPALRSDTPQRCRAAYAPENPLSPVSPRVLLVLSPVYGGRARERGAPGTKRFHISVGALVAGSRPWPAKQPRPRNRKYPFQRHYSPILTSENPIKKLICSLETPVSSPRVGRGGEVPARGNAPSLALPRRRWTGPRSNGWRTRRGCERGWGVLSLSLRPGEPGRFCV